MQPGDLGVATEQSLGGRSVRHRSPPARVPGSSMIALLPPYGNAGPVTRPGI